MAPRKAKPQPQQPSAPPTTTTASVRVTRRAAKRAADDSLAESVAARPEKKTKKPKGAANEKQKRQPPKDAQEKAEAESGNAGDASKRTIVIEHCKQCKSFKTRADMVKEGLEKGVAGITVILNPEKPRRGCFEIREEGGEKFISLLDMKRPFKPMKDLDMDEVIAEIIEKINN